MKNKVLNTFFAILTGAAIPAIPYIAFVFIIDKVGEENFHLHPGFVAVILGTTLLGLGAYTSGRIIAKGNYNKVSLLHLFLVTPGIYLGGFGFLLTFLTDGRFSKDGVVALIIVSLALTGYSAPFTFWGYRKYK